MLLEDCIKVQQKTKAFLTETEFSKSVRDQNYYWLKENGRKIKNRFFRQELFTLEEKFVE